MYQILVNLRPKCYFTHYTAMYFHELTEQIPKVIYVNVEQTPKPKSQFHIGHHINQSSPLSRNFIRDLYSGN